MFKKCIIPYKDAITIIQEGDILLFRGRSWISLFIQKASSGYYSHAAIASWNRNEHGEKTGLDVLEYREFIGSRAISFANYIEKNSGIIDVYRPYPIHYEMVFDCNRYQTKSQLRKFDGQPITDEFRTLTGLPYGYKTIWAMARRQIVFLRWFGAKDYFNDSNEKPKNPVCSTIIAYLYQKHFTDLLKFTSTDYVSPSSICTSPLLSYLFTITK